LPLSARADSGKRSARLSELTVAIRQDLGEAVEYDECWQDRRR